jgi:ATP-dependent DNA ligase
MHERLDRGAVKLLTRTGLDWTHKYPPIAAAVSELNARQKRPTNIIHVCSAS